MYSNIWRHKQVLEKLKSLFQQLGGNLSKNPKIFPGMLTFTRNVCFTENNLTNEFRGGLIHSWLPWWHLVQAHFLDILLYYCCQHLWAAALQNWLLSLHFFLIIKAEHFCQAAESMCEILTTCCHFLLHPMSSRKKV